MSAAKAPREAGIELGRIFCCFCVVLIHLSYFMPSQPDVSWAWSLAKCAATPVFFLIAGFFFAHDKPFSMYMKRITARVMIPLVAVMLVIAQLTPWLSGQGSITDCMKGLNVTNFLLVGRILVTTWPYDYVDGYNPFLSVWFSFALFLCYLFIPFLKIVCADTPSSRKLKRYVLLAGAIFFVVRVTLRCLFMDSFTFQHLDWWISQKPFYWLWLMILGHEIRAVWDAPGFREKWRRKILWGSLLVYLAGGTALFFATMAWNIAPDGQSNQLYFNREFAPYLLAQLGMFLFFMSLDPGRGLASRVILFVADKTFYTYIIHEAVYHKLLAVTGYDISRLWGFLSFGVLTFAVSTCFAVVLKRLEKTAVGLMVSCRKSAAVAGQS
ncbi:MAG: acyltransferase [Deltaproteobacteria bacterium]|jgi:surface polysaccharide O-acyltransferase-like enzyme|nr:acyltransferase [Deltaproteobacteria bacterium]